MNVQLFGHFIRRLVNFPAVKILTGIFIWLLKILFGSVLRPAYGAVIILWMVDTATGFYHARVNPKIKPSSKRMRRGLVKLGLYLFLLVLGHQCSLVEMTACIQAIIESFIILTESYSVMENLEKIARLKGVEITWLERLMKVIQGEMQATAAVQTVIVENQQK